jgi:hypothetical protein
MADSTITNTALKEIAPEIDIFAKKHIRYDYISSSSKVIVPSICGANNGPVIFTIHESIYDFTLPHIIADFKYRLVSRDGQKLPAGAAVAPIDLRKFSVQNYNNIIFCVFQFIIQCLKA